MTEKFNRTDFLEALFGSHIKETGDFILLRTVEDGSLKAANHFYPNITHLSNTDFQTNRHVYFGVCPRQKMTLGKEHVRYITALWAGLDIGPGGYSGVNNNFVDANEARKAVESFPISPSIVVQSGRGIHLYWLLESSKEITNVEIVEDLLRKLNSHFRCDSPVGVDSTLRLPGTWNPRGFRTAVKCEVEHFDPRLRYSPRDFQDFDQKLFRSPGLAVSKNPETAPVVESVVPIRLAVTNPSPLPEHPVDRVSPNSSRHAPPVLEAEESPEKPTNTEALGSPVPKDERPVGEATERVLNKLADDVADRAAQQFISNYADVLVEKIADRIVEKLVERIKFPKGD